MIFFLFGLLLFTSCYGQKDSTEVDVAEKPVINESAVTKLNSINQVEINGVQWKLGQIANEDILKKENTVFSGDFFEVAIGDLKGYSESEIQIGWNNRNRIIYISTTNSETRTIDNLGIGSTKQEVLSTLGTPYLSTSKRLRFQNLEYELQGIVFYFSEDKVIRIVLFAGI
ncbi:MAG: outer membrane protein assembly factor BamE [Bacillus subtilis]|nr:outer membrane protein assembly factor BamE [Bacillus subtilis]